MAHMCMMASVSNVNFTNTRNCFVTLPQKIKTNSKIQVVKLESPSGVVYSTGVYSNSTKSDEVGINGIFGAKQGLHHKQEVVITPVQIVPECSSVYIEPATIDDWEIIELNAAYLEENILKQIRVISRDEVFPIWIQGSLCLFVKVGRMDPPAECSLLVENTEVIITPLSRSIKRTNHIVRNESPLQGSKNSQESSVAKNSKESSVDPTPFDTDETGLLKKITRSLTSLTSTSRRENFEDLLKKETFYFTKVLLFRTLEVEKFVGLNSKRFRSWSSEQLTHIPSSEVFVCEEYLKLEIESSLLGGRRSFLAFIKKLVTEEPPERNGKNKKTLKNSEVTDPSVSKSFVVRVNVLVADELDGAMENCFKDFILIPECLRLQLEVEETSRITLEAVEDYSPFLMQPREFVVTPLFQLSNELTENMLKIATQNYFKSLLNISNDPLLLNNNQVFKCILKTNVFGYMLISLLDKNSHQQLNKSEAQIYFLSWRGLSDIPFNVDISENFKKSLLGDFYARQLKKPELTVHDEILEPGIIEDIMKYMAFCCNPHARGDSHVFRPGGMLMMGSKGSGRTTLCEQLQRTLQSQRTPFFVKFVNCNELSGKVINSMKQTLSGIFAELSLHQPSLLILDNLESITSNFSREETESSPLALLQTQVAQLLINLVMKESVINNPILILATTESSVKLHPIFTEKLFFTQFYNIASFKENDSKIKFLKKCIADVLCAFDEKSRPVNCTSDTFPASKLDGYVIRDMENVAKQAIVIALSKNQKTCKVRVTDDDVIQSLDKYIPLQMRFSKLSTPPCTNWSNVGGLQEVKITLIEALMWPTRYPMIFKNYPLPLRKGALLYGAPGTGKTLLASAAANECKLNLICIKGPELLNKFIGASEKAIRETFSRAKNAKPCVIFFDELDSLTPKRGHDNTGVTERVVNQLLAELDGVEQLEGVFILAATSRPDLIDPALLRPGRLDRLLFCPMPDAKERTEILKALTKNVNLSEDVDLEKLALVTQNFTGADLKALLYDALLETVHRFADNTQPDILDPIPVESLLLICQRHLDVALRSSRPSVQPKDRAFYEQVYSPYINGHSTNTTVVTTMRKRATLA